MCKMKCHVTRQKSEWRSIFPYQFRPKCWSCSLIRQSMYFICIFTIDGVLEPREASFDAFTEKTVSVNQAKRHLTLLQRRRCPWTKQSSTWCVFNEDSVLEPSKAALGAFSMKMVSVNQVKPHLTPLQRRRCPWTKRSGTWCLFKECSVKKQNKPLGLSRPPAQHFVHLPLALDWMGSQRQ